MKTKPVIKLPTHNIFMPKNLYEYWFFYVDERKNIKGYGSDSFANLKRKVKDLKLFSAKINTRSGQFTRGQNFIDFYFYKPRY